MKKDCSLIVTLPSLRDKEMIDFIMKSDVNAVRYNSGINDLYSPEEIVEILCSLKEKYRKDVWIDLKGRQLRIDSWADPRYEVITLNHEIEIEYPAHIYFRGGGQSEIAHTRGKKIVLTEYPEKALGKGQSVNILAKSLFIKGYLTNRDKELICFSKRVGLNNYMASFVEESSDLESIYSLNPKARIVSKIESLKGIKFMLESKKNLSLMSAREDLFIESSYSIDTLKYLRQILMCDQNAICASRIFSSLETGNVPSLSDYTDLELMYLYGYRNFMLGDELRGASLKKALNLWGEFKNE